MSAYENRMERHWDTAIRRFDDQTSDFTDAMRDALDAVYPDWYDRLQTAFAERMAVELEAEYQEIVAERIADARADNAA
jgi:hypothetical protein